MKLKIRYVLIAAVAFLPVIYPGLSQAQAARNAPAASRVSEAFRRMLPPMTPEQVAALPKWNVQTMATRDGVKLAANVFLPEGTGPFPVVLSRTSYGKDVLREMAGYEAKKYVEAGYAFVQQDVRGKGESEGAYLAFSNDIEDGYDTVEWIARQPWSNGKVGVTGSSALGITANMTAVAAPPHLVAAFVMLAPHDQLDSTYPGGVLRERDTLGWLASQGAGAEQLADAKASATNSAIWTARAMSVQRKFIRVPIYNVGGWYDVFNAGNVESFSWLQNHGSKGARGRQKLYMGAAGHGGLGGAASDVDYPQPGASIPADEELRWWDYWLKGVDNGIMDEPPVMLFMMASGRKGHPSPLNRVISAPNWPPPAKEVKYFLTRDMGLISKAPKVSDAQISYRSDPADPVPTFGGYNQLLAAGPLDQRPIGQRQDYLRFETPQLDAAVAVAGPVRMELWAATDGPDTDFVVKLVDVHPDGYEQIILENPIRTRYRHGREPDDVVMMSPGEPAKLNIDLWNTAYTFEKGHRIQVTVASSNAPKFEINPNTGAAFGQGAELKPRIAVNTIYFDRARPSALVLPIM